MTVLNMYGANTISSFAPQHHPLGGKLEADDCLVGTLGAQGPCRNIAHAGEVGRMLVLTRRLGEAIMIGDDIEVTVLASDGSKVKLGIHAPSEVPVHRREVYIEIKSQREPPVRAASRRGRAR